MAGIIDHGIKGYLNPALKGMTHAAQGEMRRNITNRELEYAQNQRRMGMISSGASLGAMYGMSKGAAVSGPVGGLIGAGVGLLMDGLF